MVGTSLLFMRMIYMVMKGVHREQMMEKFMLKQNLLSFQIYK